MGDAPVEGKAAGAAPSGAAPRRAIRTPMSDTGRWDYVKLRGDDIIVASWAKTGTS